jgi:hypothetical protein
MDLDITFKDNFSDVKESDYFYKEVGIAKTLGITTGVGNNRFDPYKSITREEIMVLVNRCLNRVKDKDKIILVDTSSGLSSFVDQNLIAAYAYDSVEVLVNNKLIIGSGNKINPKGLMTRAETAVLVYRFLNLLK